MPTFINKEETLSYLHGDYRDYEIVEHSPAADVVEVRHGRWHRFLKGSGQSGNILICSDAFQCTVCKESFWNKSNYCPNCGAKMDGGQVAAPAGPYDLLYEEGGALTT